MIITYYGKEFFKVTHGETTVAFNPTSKSEGGATRFGADMVLSSANHPLYNGIEQVTYGDREPFVVDGPGDYEVKGIFIKGGISEADIEGKSYINTVFSLTLDNINIGFLGALSTKTISSEARDALGNPDVLFVPIAGEGIISPNEAHKIALSFDPKIIIPMNFSPKGDELKIFLKEGGQEDLKPVDKIVLKRKDLEGKNAEIIVLSES